MCTSSFLAEKWWENRVTTPLRGRKNISEPEFLNLPLTEDDADHFAHAVIEGTRADPKRFFCATNQHEQKNGS